MFSLVTLLVSGVGIMNIMLATVRSRIREIGIRKALGATFREIQMQFLAEAVLISLSGGVVGTVLAMLLPLSVAFFTDYRLAGFLAFGGNRHPGFLRRGDGLRHRSCGAGRADGPCRIIEVRVANRAFFCAMRQIFHCTCRISGIS